MAARKASRSESDGAPDGGATNPPIFVCDASAEAERLMTTLRNRGHPTVDVPIGMLPSRVRYETPALVVCDADAHEALRRILEMKETTTSKVKLLFVGHDDGALRHEPEFRRLATATLTRPLNLAATADLVESIVGRPVAKVPQSKGASPGAKGRKRAPILVASARKPYRSDVDAPPMSGGPASSRFREAPDPQWAAPSSSNPNVPLIGEPHSSAPPHSPETNPVGPPSSIPPSSGDSRLSPETRALLEEGRRRVATHPVQPARPTRLPTDGEERGVPQAALLEALRRPLDDDEPSSAEPRSAPKPSDPNSAVQVDANDVDSAAVLPAREQATKSGARRDESRPSWPDVVTHPATPELASQTPGPSQLGTPIDPHWRAETESQMPVGSDRATVAPPHLRSDQPPDDQTNPGGRAPTNRPGPTSDFVRELSEPAAVSHDAPPLDDLSDLLPPDSPTPPTRAPLGRRRPSDGTTTRSRPVDAPQAGAKAPPISALGHAIRERRTCSLAQEHEGGVRRVLLKDGDVLTTTSSRDDETLPHFLHARGDLPTEALATLGQAAHFGRHAGAALIARGLLRQEDLWPVLRGHAEWLLGRLLSAPASAVLEPEVPVRARDEPAVFGGAAGAEVFIEVLRRVIDPDVAFRALGSGIMKLGLGSNQALLHECGLGPELSQRVLAATEDELLVVRERTPTLLPILLGLRELGIVSMGKRRDTTSERAKEVQVQSAALDDDAFALRVAARRALVDEGDYFTVLGVPRGATAHELDRARDALFREFAPETLPARAEHLRGDVAAILEIVAEAHEILRDEVRRDRYRRALEEVPMPGLSRR